MNELIHVEKTLIGAENVNSVNAREIYAFLGVKSRFNDWIKNRLSDFIENEDYIVVTKNLVTEANDIFVTLDTAKHLSMLERNNKGREARQYFINIEKQSILPSVPQTFSEALLLASKQAEIIEKQQLSLQQKSQTIANVVHSGNTYTASHVAKDMPNPISAHLLNKMLNEAGIIFWQNGSWQLYAKYANHNLTQSLRRKLYQSGRLE